MNQTVTLALDAAGGDHGYDVVIPAALAVVKRHKHAELILVGDQQKITAALAGKQHPQIKIQHASETVAMDESPSMALRKKKDSSMRISIDLVKNGTAQACVSAGNTGALIATARYVLKTLPGIDRPALCTVLPGIDGHTHVLDLGANIGCTAEHLYQFAFMGSILSNAVDGIEKPRVGLLNIGEEEMKGNEQVKQAASMLEQSGLNYVGFVEGDGMFKAVADVVVTDGFVGNVALKAAEGLAKMMSHYLRQEFTRNPLTKLAGLIAKPILKAFQDSVDPRHYNGASVLGLQGIVIKSHGGADATAFANAVDIALIEVRKDVPQRISATLEEQLSMRQPA